MNRTETTQEKTGNEIGHAESRTDDVVQPKDAVQDAAARGQALTGYETLTAWQTAKKFKWCTFFAVIAAFSAATDGYQIALVCSLGPVISTYSVCFGTLTACCSPRLNSGIIVNPGFIEQFATDTNAKGKPVLASNVIAAWGTILPVGQFIASSSLPFISARFGRKVAMYITVIFLAASVIAESLARKWPHWLVAKLLAGIGTGCMQVNMTTYVTEISPTRLRGRILMTYNLWWTVGQLFTYIALEVLSHQHPKSWLIPVYTQWTHVGLMAIIYFFLPESPAWAVATGHMNRARKSLTSLYRGVEGFDVEHQLQVLKLLADHEAEVAALQLQERWWAIFKGVDGFRTLVALWTLCSQQFIGLTLFTSYGTYFFQQAELGNPFQIKCITIGVKLVAAVCVVYVADSVGRRMISCSGATTMWLSCLIIGILSVVPRSKAVNAVCIMLAVFWSKSQVLMSCSWTHLLTLLLY